MSSKKSIYNAILKETGHVVELDKIDGIYYWHTETSYMWPCETCTHNVRLSDLTIDRWVQLFKTKLEEAQELV
jgi:hypothetical protein